MVYRVESNSDVEIATLLWAINDVAKETLLDHRFILAIIMQESGGCVRVPTSYFVLRNPGLMQTRNGNAFCNDCHENSTCEDEMSEGHSPCPPETIVNMVREGAIGTNEGDGLVQCLNKSGAQDVSAYYKAARLYNSGEISQRGLEWGGANNCYAMDIANRLTGWVESDTQCHFRGM